MAVFPLSNFDVEDVKMRVFEEFVTAGLNKKALSSPIGIYRGLDPTVTAAEELTLEADTTTGDHVAVTHDGTGRFSLTHVPEGDIVLDFTGHTTYPVLVVVEGEYTPPSPGSTSGSVKTITPGSFDILKHIKVCEVTKPGASIVVDTTVPTNRQEPIAFSGVEFGFMPGGSVEDLQAAAATTAEVQQARTGFSTTFADLDTRLDNELSGPSMASRLANLIQRVSGTDLTGVTGTTANVSRDFKTRTVQPSATDKGVVVTTPFNDVLLRDDTFASISASGARVYGRLTKTKDTTLTGTLDFTNASTTVEGTGTNFTGEVDAGDIILGDDGIWYEVASITDADTLELVDPYGGTTASGVSVDIRQFTLSFFTRDNSGTETAHNFTAAQDIRWWFSQVFDTSDRDPTPDHPVPEDRLAIPSVQDFRSAVSVDYSNAGNVTTDTETDTADGEVYAKVTGNANVQTVEVNYAFSMLQPSIDQVTVPYKFTDSTGSNQITVRVLDSDGTLLGSDVDSAPGSTRQTIVIAGSSLSSQPTDRFIVQVLIELDDADEARVGGTLVAYA